MIIYNEIESNAAEWMKNLIDAGEIPQGKIDARPIQQITGTDLSGVRQFHTFAGIGGWPLALRLAGWPEDREVWTGSCPCQPFSSAGKGKGVEDERHLWPEFFRLIAERRPATVFGEQVGSKAGIGWLDGVQADLEGEGYACGAVIVGAHSVGAPHIRQRIYWVAHRDDLGRRTEHGEARDPRGEVGLRDGALARDGGAVGGLADDDDEGLQDGREGRSGQNGSTVTPWSDYRIVPCTDGKARRTGSRVFPLAYGLPRGVGDGGTWRKGLARSASRARVGMLKGSGNAIVPSLAAEFIRAYMEMIL